MPGKINCSSLSVDAQCVSPEQDPCPTAPRCPGALRVMRRVHATTFATGVTTLLHAAAAPRRLRLDWRHGSRISGYASLVLFVPSHAHNEPGYLSQVTRREHAAAFANGMDYFATCGGCTAAGAAGLAVMRVVAAEDLQARALATGAHLMARLRVLQKVCHPAGSRSTNTLRLRLAGAIDGSAHDDGLGVIIGSGTLRDPLYAYRKHVLLAIVALAMVCKLNH